MDVKKPLTDREAGRVMTVLEQVDGKRLLLRQLRGFSPEEISKNHGLKAEDIARMAGRKPVSQ